MGRAGEVVEMVFYKSRGQGFQVGKCPSKPNDAGSC